VIESRHYEVEFCISDGLWKRVGGRYQDLSIALQKKSTLEKIFRNQLRIVSVIKSPVDVQLLEEGE